GVLRTYGIGGWRFYMVATDNSSQTTYISPANDNGTLVLDKTNSLWTYTLPDGSSLTFNSYGQQTGWSSADGNETLAYRYAGSGGNLTGMTAIDGALSTFTYSGSLLQTVQTGSRTVTLTDSGSNLTSITNPDGGLHTLTYDGSHHATGETFANLQD